MKATLSPPPTGPHTRPSWPGLNPRYVRLHREMVDQVERTAAVENHWLMYLILGWEHLAACVASHAFLQGPRASESWLLGVLWLAQIFLALATARLITGKPRIEDSPLQPYIRNLWLIFLLLCCNVGLLAVAEGQPVVNFLPFLATLSSFLFLVLSFLFSRRFVAAALMMFLVGSLMARFPQYGFLLYGAGWLVILQTLGVLFARKRKRWLATLEVGK